MARFLVTGATGLIGSNICRLLLGDGTAARALVRPGSDAGALEAIGVEVVRGDVTVADDVRKAADGCDAIVNAAAALGGAAQRLDEQRATNLGGARNAFDAGRAHGIRVVTLSTTTFFRHDHPLTESSPVADEWADDPYTRTKGDAYCEARRRVDDEGADIVVVVPGGTFGPGVSVPRALAPTSYNRLLRGALNGKVSSSLSYLVPWVYAEDVASAAVAAARHGKAGRTYLAFGAEDAQTTASWLNAACEVAGVPHRVEEVAIDGDGPVDPALAGVYGETLVALARRRFPVPWFDNGVTRAELGYAPRPLHGAMEATCAWLHREGQIRT